MHSGIGCKNSRNSSHLLNTSSSKQRYSFSKSIRFTEPKEIHDLSYDLPSIKDRRSTSFGYGEKDFGMRYEKNSPSPERYDLPSDFQKSKSNRGFGFGKGRQQMEITGAFQEVRKKSYLPGPGKYEKKSSLEKLGKISIGEKIKSQGSKQSLKSPGPGEYNWEQMGNKNYYVTSRHVNKVNFKISDGTRPSFIEVGEKSPVGPGQYNSSKISDLNKEGKYVLSKNKGSLAQRFSTSPRQPPHTKHLLKFPCPTKYQKVSEFGN